MISSLGEVGKGHADIKVPQHICAEDVVQTTERIAPGKGMDAKLWTIDVEYLVKAALSGEQPDSRFLAQVAHRLATGRLTCVDRR